MPMTYDQARDALAEGGRARFLSRQTGYRFKDGRTVGCDVMGQLRTDGYAMISAGFVVGDTPEAVKARAADAERRRDTIRAERFARWRRLVIDAITEGRKFRVLEIEPGAEETADGLLDAALEVIAREAVEASNAGDVLPRVDPDSQVSPIGE